MDLFDTSSVSTHGIPVDDERAPLAVRMRPRSLDDIVGQPGVLDAGSPVRRLIETKSGTSGVSSVILFGPPGVGKTTIAYLVARLSGRHFREVSAVSAGVKEVRAVVNAARRRLSVSGEETVLFIDEVHRFSKSQQDALLPAVENRWVTLVAATTENPSFSIIAPLLSRSILVTLQLLDDEAIRTVIERARTDARGLDSTVTIDDDALAMLVRLASGDARHALTLLEAAAAGTVDDGRDRVSAADVSQAADSALIRYGNDDHYDVASAFIKSMRGSDVDAAVHYLARMLEAGEDPRFIARRVMIAAAEDVGMADPTVLPLTVSAAQAVGMVGMPEARIILSQAVVAVASAAKSNAAYLAIDRAIADVRAGKGRNVPLHLRDAHYREAKALGHGEGYRYAHDEPHAVAAQQYLPDDLEGVEYYQPTSYGHESHIQTRLAKVRALLKMR